MNDQLNHTAQERMRDRDQAEIADLSKPLGMYVGEVESGLWRLAFPGLAAMEDEEARS